MAAVWLCLFGMASSVNPSLADENTGKKSPHYDLHATSETFQLGTEESVLAWENWHRRVSKLLAKRINHAMRKRMMGKAMLRMKIDRNQNVAVELLPTGQSRDFALKCLEGAKTLNKDENVKFPQGSKRSDVSFDVTFKRGWLTIPGVKFTRDDYERLSP